MNEKEANQNLSTQKVLLPGHDPGWNDPPKWVYTGAQSSATPAKRMLNKRVAFPLVSTKANDKESSSETKSLNMPPLLQPSNLTTALTKDVDVKVTEIKIDKEKVLSDVLEKLNSVINEHVLEKHTIEEVRKRLDILKSMWLEDQLNNVIYKNILDLSTALQEGNVEKADQIHVTLMMQYASLCSSWIPGIRHIILELKSRTQDANATRSQNSESHLFSVEENH
ncbi:steroid receptor RNA activator 1-like [Osmia bicornis bicornis]|uniref:steroid receptor RNA activator 1-like n=1 Tax=Osmia bicornis bicornis TaxID=1437191 RepID=UPI0010F5214F|nr:steroid receptor RNA activator 1-like [Osmia bicornis bicornis]